MDRVSTNSGYRVRQASYEDLSRRRVGQVVEVVQAKPPGWRVWMVESGPRPALGEASGRAPTAQRQAGGVRDTKPSTGG